VAANEGKYTTSVTLYEASYFTRTEEEIQAYRDSWWDFYAPFVARGDYTTEEAWWFIEHGLSSWKGIEHRLPWERDSRGRLMRENNACTNGTVSAAIDGLVANDHDRRYTCFMYAANVLIAPATAKKTTTTAGRRHYRLR